MPADRWPAGRDCAICDRVDPIVDDGRGPVQVHDPVKFDAVAPDLLELTPDPDRAPRLSQGVAWVREGEEAELDGRLYLPRTPRGPRDPL